MTINRIKELETIRTGFSLPPGEPDAAVLYSLTGLYGTGKSVFAGNLMNELIDKDATDALMIVKDFTKFNFLTDLASVMAYSLINRHNSDSKLNSSETNYNLNKFYELLNEMKTKEYSLYEKYCAYYSLTDYYARLTSQRNEEEQTEIEKLVSALYAKKGDRRLLLEMPVVVVESLIVDLMNYYLPQTNLNNSLRNFIADHRKIKIVILFDNIDPLDYSVVHWLSNCLLPYAFEKHFVDFVSFKIPDMAPELRISDIFDFRFVVGLRRNLAQYSLPELQYYNALNQSIAFEPLSKEELSEFLTGNEIAVSASHAEIYNRTKGFQNLLVNYLSNTDENKTDDLVESLSPIIRNIFDGRNEEQINWIVWTSYLGTFNKKSLTLFPDIAPREEEVFAYLSTCCESGINEDQLYILPEIRSVIHDYISITQPQNSSIFRQISEVHESIKPFLDRFNDSEMQMLKNLAYFEKFEAAMLSDAPFNCKHYYITQLIGNYPELFLANTYSVSLQPEVRNALMLYNGIIDPDADEKQIKAGKLWEEYYSDIGVKILGIEQDILDLKISVDVLDNEIKSAREVNLKDQTEFFDCENKINELNKQALKFSLRKNLKPVILNLSMGILAALATLFSAEIFSGTFIGNEPWSDVSYWTLFSVSALFTLVGLIWLLRTTVYRNSVKEMKVILGQLSELNIEKKTASDKMEISSSQLREIDGKINLCENAISEKQSEIEKLRNKLVEN